MGEIGKGFHTLELGGLDERVGDGGGTASALGGDEQKILAIMEIFPYSRGFFSTGRGNQCRAAALACYVAPTGKESSAICGAPHIPYSEAQFKTLKYRPEFPDRFGSIEHARAHCQTFFTWYNTVHRHSGIGHMTPETVHYGRATALTARRRSLTLQAAFLANPNRFKGTVPQPPEVPLAAWINPPTKKEPTLENQTDNCSLNSISQVLQSH